MTPDRAQERPRRPEGKGQEETRADKTRGEKEKGEEETRAAAGRENKLTKGLPEPLSPEPLGPYPTYFSCI